MKNLLEIINETRLYFGADETGTVITSTDTQIKQMRLLLQRCGDDIAQMKIGPSGWSFLENTFTITPFVETIASTTTANSSTFLIPNTALINTGDIVTSKAFEGRAVVLSKSVTSLVLDKPATSSGTFEIIVSRQEYDLPDDYLYLLKNTYNEVNGILNRYSYALTPQETSYLDIPLYETWYYCSMFEIKGRKIKLYPLPTATSPVKLKYISKYWIKDTNGNRKPEFTSNDDVCLIDSKLLSEGLLWKYRAVNKVDYAEEKAQYEKTLNSLMFDDAGGANNISLSRHRYNGYPYINLPEGNWNI
jgi:hypothetical protein